MKKRIGYKVMAMIITLFVVFLINNIFSSITTNRTKKSFTMLADVYLEIEEENLKNEFIQSENNMQEQSSILLIQKVLNKRFKAKKLFISF